MTMKNIARQCRDCIEGRKVVVDILAVLFGMGAWVGVNGVFVQLPLLVKTAPEGWNLPSYMSITVQLANIGPILYALCRRWRFSKLNDAKWIYSILLIGAISAMFMAFYYQHTDEIGGEKRSSVFLVMVFFQSIVGCTSSVLFFPFMRHFKEIYLISYLIGEGLSGFLPSLLALIQGVGGNPKCTANELPNGNVTYNLEYKDPLFATKYFFIFLSIVLTISFISFVLLNNLNVCLKEKVSDKNEKGNKEGFQMETYNSVQTAETDNSQTDEIDNTKKRLSTLTISILLLLIAVICAFSNGVFPSIQSYSCLPYGNTAYHLSVTLSSMANPTACFIAVFMNNTSYKWIAALSSICSVLIAYVMTTSILSPMPPLVDTTYGIVSIVLVWIFVVGLVSYIKLCASTIFRSEGGSWLFYCGSVSQIGSAIGSIVSFILINHVHIFVTRDPCH